MRKAVAAAALCAVWAGATAAPASADTWQYSNNGKGNHYLMAGFGPFSVTFGCNGAKIIGFFSLPMTIVDDDLKKAKAVYAVMRIDGDERGNGIYVWLSGKPDISDDDFNINMELSQPLLVKALRDIGAAEKSVAFATSLDNPAKGRFEAKYSFDVDLDGAAEAIPQLFEACKIK